MNRFIASVAIVISLAGTSAFAADTTTPAMPTATPADAPAAAPTAAKPTMTTLETRTASCASLSAQWDTAAAANETNKKLAKAKTGAAKAKTNCDAETSAKKKTGISQYKAALKLLGVTATKS